MSPPLTHSCRDHRDIYPLTGERGDHGRDVSVEVLDLVVVGDPGRGDLGQHARRLDAVLERRGAAAQQALYHIQAAALKHINWSEVARMIKVYYAGHIG